MSALAEIRKHTEEGLHLATVLAKRALEIDPSYVPAASFIGLCRASQRVRGWGPISDADVTEAVRLETISDGARRLGDPGLPTGCRNRGNRKRPAQLVAPRDKLAAVISMDRSSMSGKGSKCVSGNAPSHRSFLDDRGRPTSISLIGAPVPRLECFDPSILKTEPAPVTRQDRQ
jgi:hypothetical protein